MNYIGIDLGGTNIKGALVSAKGEILKEHSIPTRVDLGPEAVAGRIGQVIAQLSIGEDTVGGVGVGCPAAPFLHFAVSYPIFMQESCGNISQEPILPCKKILKIWRSGKLGIDIFPAWEYGNANNFKRPIARSGR